MNERRGTARVRIRLLGMTAEQRVWARPKVPRLGGRIEFKPEGYDVPWQAGVVVACEGSLYLVDRRL